MSRMTGEWIQRLKDKYKGNLTWPACYECMHNVSGYELENYGRVFGGRPFVDIKAWCHGNTRNEGFGVNRILVPEEWGILQMNADAIISNPNVRTAAALMRFYEPLMARKQYTVHWPSHRITISRWE